MKKSLLLFALLPLMAACGHNDNKQEQDINDLTVRLKGYQYSEVSQMTGDTDSIFKINPYMRNSGEGVMPVKIGNNDIAALRDSLMSMGNMTKTDGKLRPVLVEGFEFSDKIPADVQPGSESASKLTVDLITPDVIVWRSYVSIYYYMAAHGLYATSFLNYSIADNKILTLADLFQADKLPELLEMIRERLAENADVFEPSEAPMPKEFAITRDGMEFLYGVYDIAPYAAGEIKVDFDVYELEELLKPEAFNLINGSSQSE